MPRREKSVNQEFSSNNSLPNLAESFPGLGNMNEIVNMAQKIAQNVSHDNKDLTSENLDMSKLLSQVSGEVSKIITPDFINQINNPMNVNNQMNDTAIENSKISLDKPKKKIKEINENQMQKTKDLYFTLNVTLEELYNGKTKKLAVRRKKLIQEGNNKKIIDEKKKLSVIIEPGMFDEQVITFSNQADEKEGYETGDIIITLCCSENNKYTRDGDNLILEQEISIYEMFKPEFSIEFINGKIINIKSTPINIFGEELDSFRKLKNYGMPILNTNNKTEKLYGDLLIQFKPILPNSITDDNLNLLKQIFPPINKINNDDNTINELELVTESDFEFSDDESNLDESESDENDSDESNSDENDLDENDSDDSDSDENDSDLES